MGNEQASTRLRLIHSANDRALRARILVVDDEPLVLDCFARMLERHYDVTLAHDGLEALERLATLPRFDAVLCDLTMPGCGGMGIFRQLEVSDPAYLDRFLFITGGILTEEIESFRAKLRHPLLEKPVVRQELLAALEAVTSRHAVHAPMRAGAASV